MKNQWKRMLLWSLSCFLLFAAACGKADLDQASKSEQTNKSAIEDDKTQGGERLQTRNALPADGIVTQAQLASIAGKEGIYEFYAVDEATGITYTWRYDGAKIQNAAEQVLLTSFTEEGIEEVKELANHATVGLGVTLPQTILAAPATLELFLPEKWDADAVILCKMVENAPAKVTDVTIESREENGKEVTALTFQVLETGATYYLVGGNTSPVSASGENKGALQQEGAQSDAGEWQGETENQSVMPDAPGAGALGEGKQEQSGEKESQSAAAESPNTDASDGENKEETVHTCTLSIDCITILSNMQDLKQEKSDFVPSDGWIVYTSTIEYTPGETVYDILYRICREAGIHMEASFTPMYGSYYVEGINQLYEFDCGSLSGWMYSVNGWYPNYGCSKYTVNDNDVIKWRYTCDLGRDVGGYMGD